ncbi:probable ATP-dependent DNA helicase HFM1 [Pollicipes pollicipes]|uniref:probable ATP-dependent DNA helicase HFM1 n=1 Tax=Pollicipes pollicipes TaxID=41117 RepID=UPI001885035B|nr:probable ATP-dependent DNA helicase HFM1 [Pollicipes pollicipes]
MPRPQVHLLNDPQRGPTLEAVVSRMKNSRDLCHGDSQQLIRCLAISATIPNADDIGEWLGSEGGPAVTHKLAESLRPVRLRRVVLGYPCPDKWSHFRFDLSLNYKLAAVLHTYSDQKPALVFCSTRKGCQQAAAVLVKEARFVSGAEHKVRLTRVANLVTDGGVRELLLRGVGVHHAGLAPHDRHCVEQLFLDGDLPVLFCTSTLAMGVNLPAHLVVVKSTSHYTADGCGPYSDAEVLQMTGRAGRPQFETSATAVIMTQVQHRSRYEALLSGTQLTESWLHLHLIAHLNAEVVLGTVTDVEVALRWLRSTFLYVRALRNPTHYGLPPGLPRRQVEDRLQDLCMVELNRLAAAGLISKGEVEVSATPSGRLMARFCISFQTMQTLQQMSGTEDLSALLAVLSACGEFEGIQLRTSDKRALNALNRDPHRSCVRYPLPGRVKTTQMKVNVLVQSVLGSLPIADPSLSQDANKIFRVAERVMRSRCCS